MNIDPIQYAYISIVADGILSIIMIFQWLVARKEKHALFWGIAQLAFMTSTLIWYFSAMSQDMRVAFCALLNVIFLAGHWGGTRFFFGGLRPGEGKRALWIFATLAIILQIWWHYVPSVLPRASTFILGMLLIWIGFTLARIGPGADIARIVQFELPFTFDSGTLPRNFSHGHLGQISDDPGHDLRRSA